MKTIMRNAPFIKQTYARDYVIALEDLEFAFSKEQLDEIKELHNEGFHYTEISKEVYRNKYEIIVALLHLVKGGHAMRPFGDVSA